MSPVISIDAQDIMGSHVVDIGAEIKKIRLDANGSIKADSRGSPVPDGSLGEPREQHGEGCRLRGKLDVQKVCLDWLPSQSLSVNI